MSAGTFISRVLGLVRDMVIAAFFSRTETDAFFVAFRLPNFFRRFLGEGALSISFIPLFIHCLSGSEKASVARAKNLMNSVYTCLLVGVLVLTVLGIVFMEPMVQALLAGTFFAEVPGKLGMVIVMARLLFFYLFLVILYAYFMGVANALGSFFIPALAPALLNLCIIIFSFLPKNLVPFPAMLLCWAVLLGGVMQVVLTAVLLFRKGYLPRITLSFSGKDLKLMGSRFLPGIFGVGGFALIGLLNLYFSAWLEEGTHTYIYYGDRLLELPRSLIAISLGTALLPSLSHFSARGEMYSFLKSAAEQRDILLFLILPCALGFYFMGPTIVEVLFQRGRFDVLASAQTALVLKIYSLLLISSSLCRVLATCFYAIKNVWYPAICSCLYVLFHALLAPYMTRSLELEGLITATVISNFFFMFLLLGAYPYFIGSLYFRKTFRNLLHSLPLLLIFALYLWVSQLFFKNFLSGELFFLKALTLIVVILSASALYFALGSLIRLPQAFECTALLKRRLQKKQEV